MLQFARKLGTFLAVAVCLGVTTAAATAQTLEIVPTGQTNNKDQALFKWEVKNIGNKVYDPLKWCAEVQLNGVVIPATALFPQKQGNAGSINILKPAVAAGKSKVKLKILFTDGTTIEKVQEVDFQMILPMPDPPPE